MSQSYELQCFEKSNELFKVNAQISVGSSEIQLSYLLEGPLERLADIPSKNSPLKTVMNKRRSDVWKSTCFEFFVKTASDSPYWEWNFGPLGDWGYFTFSKYRCAQTNLGPEAESLAGGLVSLQTVALSSTQLQTRATIRPSFSEFFYWALETHQDLEFNLTAVLNDKEHGNSFWAPRHGKDKPEFHDASLWI